VSPTYLAAKNKKFSQKEAHEDAIYTETNPEYFKRQRWKNVSNNDTSSSPTPPGKYPRNYSHPHTEGASDCPEPIAPPAMALSVV
jgi:hypothetical protein